MAPAQYTSKHIYSALLLNIAHTQETAKELGRPVPAGAA